MRPWQGNTDVAAQNKFGTSYNYHLHMDHGQLVKTHNTGTETRVTTTTRLNVW